MASARFYGQRANCILIPISNAFYRFDPRRISRNAPYLKRGLFRFIHFGSAWKLNHGTVHYASEDKVFTRQLNSNIVKGFFHLSTLDTSFFKWTHDEYK